MGIRTSLCFSTYGRLHAVSRMVMTPSTPSCIVKPSPVVAIGVGRRGLGRNDGPRRAASPLAPLAEDGLDVQDWGAVDRFEIADRDGIVLDRLDRDGVQADRVRTVGRAGREHAR